MTLDERIAKRKADGWSVHFIIKQGDCALDADGYFWSRDDGYAWERYLTIDDAKVSLSELDEPRHARIVPVFTRTIKAYSFWQACKMAMAGKKIRRVGDDMRAVMDAYCNEVRWDNGSSVTITGHNINARWELAE